MRKGFLKAFTACNLVGICGIIIRLTSKEMLGIIPKRIEKRISE